MNTNNEDYPWLKSKGYLHLTPQLNVVLKRNEIISKVTDPTYVANYCFFPLIHSSIKERKYKRESSHSSNRSHSHFKHGRKFSNAKCRPLHYSSNMDALIFGYYAQILLEKYNQYISIIPKLSESIIAYRKLPLDDGSNKNKSTIHFAKEVFDEIKLRADPECIVLKYDIKSFFNRMDHKLLLKAWMDLLQVPKLPDHHYNVYKNCVDFSYILKDELRINKNYSIGKKSGFDEKRLSDIRTEFGFKAFFPSLHEFRKSIKRGDLKIHKYPFRHTKTKYPVGIPQGLPISSVLANLYLLQFDLKIINDLVNTDKNCFYRRYSDDIIIICNPAQADVINSFINSNIEERKVEMSPNKTEKFIFKKTNLSQKKPCLSSIKIENGIEKHRFPLTYLGLEFYGYKTLIKSSNLAKFYRRMIFAVKRKANRAILSSKKNPLVVPAIFFNQLNKLYTKIDLNSTNIRSRRAYLKLNERGEFSMKVKKINKKFNSNYLKYVERVNDIIGGRLINRQIRNHKKILHMALKKHFFDKLSQL